MIGLRAGTRVWLAAGVTDMRCGMDTLAARVQTALAEVPYSGHVFVFRGRRGDLIRLMWSDGDGMCLLAKRLERGRFVWPQAEGGVISLSTAQFRCCSKALTGEDPSEPGSRARRRSRLPDVDRATTVGVGAGEHSRTDDVAGTACHQRHAQRRSGAFEGGAEDRAVNRPGIRGGRLV